MSAGPLIILRISIVNFNDDTISAGGQVNVVCRYHIQIVAASLLRVGHL